MLRSSRVVDKSSHRDRGLRHPSGMAAIGLFSDQGTKRVCPICSKLFLESRVVDHIMRMHPAQSVRGLTEINQPRSHRDPSGQTSRTFACDRCSRTFDTERDFVRHWWGRHGRNLDFVNLGAPQYSEISRLLAALPTPVRAVPKADIGNEPAPNRAETFGPLSASWKNGRTKLRKGGGADRGYSLVKNKMMARRAVLLSQAKLSS
jgi:hypothetical protein